MSLTNLLARVNAAAGPDRELDEAIGLQIAGLKRTIRIGHEILGNEREVPVHCPKYTSSLDETLALVERVLPRWEFNLSVEYPDDQCGDAIWRISLGDPLLGFDAEAPTPALAILAAALEALAYLQPAATQGDVGNSQLTRDA